MWIESVTAIAFGPFRNESLVFAPHLTVIYGPNEAGKSSWHAAIYSALCGMRRARGVRGDDRDFAERRRPWIGDEWEVRSTVRLDDGRRVELRQNLEDLAHCSAQDADLGRDVLAEILNEGTPDASKWLGLDRLSFLSVACVRQAEVQAVADDASSLQEELQRAAASAARNETAAEAIARLEEFIREQVGQERANSTKPLQRAKTRLSAAESALERAREKHARWLTFEVRALEMRSIADETARTLRWHQALQAVRASQVLEAKREKAQQLFSKYPGGPIAPLPDEETLAGDVAAALSEWEHRPPVPEMSGPSAAMLRVEIGALPETPSGERAMPPELATAKSAHDRAAYALELHEQQRPPAPASTDAKGLSGGELRELARLLETKIPAVDTALEERYTEAQSKLGRMSAGPPRVVIAVLAAAAVLGGAGAWTFGWPVLGPALVAVGLALFGWLVFGSGDARRARALEDIRAVEADALSKRKTVEDAKEQVKAARAQAKQLGLVASASALRDLADGLLLVEQQREAQTGWLSRGDELRARLSAASTECERLLVERGVADTTNLAAALAEYEAACLARAEQSGLATLRKALADQLSAQEAAEQAAQAAQTRRSSAERGLLEAAARCGLEATDPEAVIPMLRRWQQSRAEALTTFDQAARESAELQALLAGDSLEHLEELAAASRDRAAVLVAEFETLPEVAEGPGLDEEVARLTASAQEAAVAAGAADAAGRERSDDVPSVAEAEEAVVAARREFDRVTVLSQTLSSTLEFLQNAEDRVHRDIAPVLAAGLRRWLPAVTQGRYTDARVDPSSLSVQVLGLDTEWRDAKQLSHGTAEQIYLLLRVVLAERLATTGEACPLLLDDVLVQSDSARKSALLDVILSVSRERQVILLTQEDDVLKWAQQRLSGDDRLITLPGPVSAQDSALMAHLIAASQRSAP